MTSLPEPARRIMIDPVTRIEGHSKISLLLGDDGEVQDAQFQVTQFRGFEKFTEGRHFTKMPSITSHICGICPVSHLLAATKACDMLLGVQIPPVAANLRRIVNLAQSLQSHSVSFFHFSSPDLLLGFDAAPSERHLFGVLEANPQLARDGIALRKFGQRVIERIAGKRIHPTWFVPGGVSNPLSAQVRDEILAEIPEAMAATERTLDTFKPLLDRFKAEIDHFANFPTMFMGLIGPDGELEHTDGDLRMIGADGQIVESRIEPLRYHELLGEEVESYSYLKSPYYRPVGYPEGIYRVGPLARLNMITRCGTPKADEQLEWFRSLEGGKGPIQSSFHYHAARLVEIVYIIEKIEQLLNLPDITSEDVLASGELTNREGVGISEAPRGTLLHHYQVDDKGNITNCNMIIATGNNNLAMNRGILQAAKYFVHGNDLKEGALNRVEAVIRAYDPCLSCSTHAFGEMPLEISLIGPNGDVLDRVRRS